MKYKYERLKKRCSTRDEISNYLNSLGGRVIHYNEIISINERLRKDLFPEGRFYILEILIEITL